MSVGMRYWRCSVRAPSRASASRGIEARTGEVWPLNVGQVYTTLQRLERDGLVAAVGEDAAGEPAAQGAPQKAYQIADVGSASRQGLRVPPDLSTPPRDDLVMKILIAAWMVARTWWPVSAARRAIRTRVGVAQLADEDHVGRLAHRLAEPVLERRRVAADLDVRDERLLVGVLVLDRVLDREDLEVVGAR